MGRRGEEPRWGGVGEEEATAGEQPVRLERQGAGYG